MCLRRVFLAFLLAVMPFQSLRAQAPVRLLSDPERDVQQTTQARRLLALDPDLQEHNVGVIVRDRVATLWGPAASAEVAFRAELCLRMMIELVEIRNELFVSDFLDPVRRRVKVDHAKQVFPEWITPPAASEPPLIRQAPFAIKMGAAEMKRRIFQDLPPIPLPQLGSPQIEPDVTGERDQRLLDTVRTAFQGNDRFRAVLFAVQEGRVSLKMAEPDSEILHEAAQIVSRLPDVAAVLVMVKSNPR